MKIEITHRIKQLIGARFWRVVYICTLSIVHLAVQLDYLVLCTFVLSYIKHRSNKVARFAKSFLCGTIWMSLVEWIWSGLIWYNLFDDTDHFMVMVCTHAGTPCDEYCGIFCITCSWRTEEIVSKVLIWMLNSFSRWMWLRYFLCKRAETHRH